MKPRHTLLLAACCLLFPASNFLYPSSLRVVRAEGLVAARQPLMPVADGTWYFTVSGDSRDCGDLIMPKIARAIKDDKTPIEFYWHLGDFRRIFQVDCDYAKRINPQYDCQTHSQDPKVPFNESYINGVWTDFINWQVQPLEKAGLRVYLGIGNHEVTNYTLEDKTKGQMSKGMFQNTFRKWLTWDTLRNQVKADLKKNIPSRQGETYYHFITRGVDFIYLDNSDGNTFTEDQIVWLKKVIEADQRDDKVKTLIVGMHDALPFSKSQRHAMDASCDGLCTGKRVYRMLYNIYKPTQPGAQHKQVYVIASHSHYFQEQTYNTPRHISDNDVLPGWIIGTAGAEQYQDVIKYGYAKVGVHQDGTITLEFKEVKRDSPSILNSPNIPELTNFCFDKNKVKKGEPVDTHKNESQCPKCDIE
jgi:hypothetical protein